METPSSWRSLQTEDASRRRELEDSWRWYQYLKACIMPSLIRVFAVRMKKTWILSYPLSAQQRLWSNWHPPSLIRVFAGRTVILLVLSWGGSLSMSSSVCSPYSLELSSLCQKSLICDHTIASSQCGSWCTPASSSHRCQGIQAIYGLLSRFDMIVSIVFVAPECSMRVWILNCVHVKIGFKIVCHQFRLVRASLHFDLMVVVLN